MFGSFIGRQLVHVHPPTCASDEMTTWLIEQVITSAVTLAHVGLIGSVGAVGNVAVVFPVRFWCPASVSTNHVYPVMSSLDFWMHSPPSCGSLVDRSWSAPPLGRPWSWCLLVHFDWWQSCFLYRFRCCRLKLRIGYYLGLSKLVEIN